MYSWVKSRAELQACFGRSELVWSTGDAAENACQNTGSLLAGNLL